MKDERAQIFLAFKFLASEGWVCHKAVVPNGRLFFLSVEYKIFIILAESLNFLPHVDLGLRNIKNMFFKNMLS